MLQVLEEHRLDILLFVRCFTCHCIIYEDISNHIVAFGITCKLWLWLKEPKIKIPVKGMNFLFSFYTITAVINLNCNFKYHSTLRPIIAGICQGKVPNWTIVLTSGNSILLSGVFMISMVSLFLFFNSLPKHSINLLISASFRKWAAVVVQNQKGTTKS